MRYAKFLGLIACVGCTSGVERAAPNNPLIRAPSGASTAAAIDPAEVVAPAPTSLAADQGEMAILGSYDLKSDVQARIKQAKLDLGEAISICEVKDVFVIVGPRGQVAGAARTAELAIEAYLNGRFTRAPERAVSVYLFPSARPYQAYCRKRWEAPCISGFGFYGHDERQIVLDVGLGVGTLTHELVHPIFQQDFPKAPIWIEEGIASLYEGFAFGRRGEIRGVKNWRLPILVAALGNPRQRDRAALDALFGLRDAAFRGDDESLNYAMARYFCLWMEQKNLLWSFYQKWRDNFEADESGQKSFEAVAGLRPSEANQAWQRWVRAL